MSSAALWVSSAGWKGEGGTWPGSFVGKRRKKDAAECLSFDPGRTTLAAPPYDPVYPAAVPGGCISD